MSILIKNADLVNPHGGANGPHDIFIRDGVFAKIEKKLDERADRVIDANGLRAFPGLVDMHCHLREPGFEYKEDVASGTRAAVRGGFTSVACMANTFPVADNPAVVAYIRQKAGEAGYARVYPIGAVTKGLAGKELSDMALLKEAGAVAFSDDGMPVSNGGMMRNALLYAKGLGLPVISHCEDLSIKGEGLANEGYNATIAGLKGIPRAAEEAMIARDILLCEGCGGRLHIAHVTTEGGAEIIRQAKKRGVNVTAETCPHYFAADDSLIADFDTNAKVNPPLRTPEDCAAIVEALRDGTIDVIATDHAPHHIDEKNVEFELAASGLSGFETAFSLACTILLPKGFTPGDLCTLLSYRPARILGIRGGVIEKGAPADIMIADMDETYVLRTQDMVSKGKNTPFAGRELKGKVYHTLVGGKLCVYEGNVIDG